MKVVTFGELMLRLAPKGYYRFVQANEFQATFGGAEANVAADLVNYGAEAAFVTKLPSHEIGQLAVNSLKTVGVDTSLIIRGGDRVGVYYCEKGASQRASKVIYDRAHSAVADAAPSEFDWDKIFDDACWFHFTGITPALSENAFKACIEALTAAKRRGITVSCDLNFRKKLWSQALANERMSALMPSVDYCIANEEDAKDVFGIEADNSDINGGKLDSEGYISVAKKLTEKFGFKGVAITLRESISASDNNWSGMFFSDGKAYFSKKYAVRIVDRVGGGDSFGAGLIYSLINGYGAQKTIDFAAAASCLKQTIEGDYNCVSADEILKLAGGDASGRVQR